MTSITGTIRLLNGQDVQGTITELTNKGRSGYTKVDGREMRVEFFYNENHQVSEASTYKDGLWYEQIIPDRENA